MSRPHPRLLLLLLLPAAAQAAKVTLQKESRFSNAVLGYELEAPKGYEGLLDERDNGTDTVVLWPKGTKVEFQDMGDIAKVRKLRLVIVNVLPKARLKADFHQMRSDHVKFLQQRKARFSSREGRAPAGAYSAFTIQTPSKHTVVLLEGTHNIFEVLAGADSPALRSVLKSIRESAPSAAAAEEKKNRQDLMTRLDEMEKSGQAKFEAELREKTGLVRLEARRTADGFLGQYGEYYPVPSGYEVGAHWAYDDPTISIVTFSPKGTPREALEDVSKFARHAVFVVEVIPKLEKGTDYMAMVEKAHREGGSAQGYTAAFERLGGYAVPALRVRSTGARERVETFLDGEKILFKFVSGKADARLETILSGFSPDGKPRKPAGLWDRAASEVRGAWEAVKRLFSR